MSEHNRRDFLVKGGAALAGMAVAGSAFAHSDGADGHTHESDKMMASLIPGAYGDNGEFVLPPLGYDYAALEPHIDATTMRIHHDKHHAGYVKGLNAANKELAKMRESGDFGLIQHWSDKVAFNGGGHMLHSIFWDCMGPDGGGEPSGPIRAHLEKDFGGIKQFMAHFSAAAKGVEGSGWGILALQIPSKSFVIVQGQNQQLNTQWGMIPILCLDVWEHAYYLNYQNNRGGYVDAWWNVVDWKKVSARYDMAMGMLK